ncbi:Uncharacterised protein [uncultured archaeon]|nr:Uncharacterised protein [uncultured archaeon]
MARKNKKEKTAQPPKAAAASLSKNRQAPAGLDLTSLPPGVDKKKMAELVELAKKLNPVQQKMADMQAKNKAEPTPDYRKLAREEDAAEYQKKLAAPPRIIHFVNGGSVEPDGRGKEKPGGGGFEPGPKLQFVQDYDAREYRVFGEAHIVRGGARIRLYDYYFDRGKGPVTPVRDGDVIETKAGSYVWGLKSVRNPMRGEGEDEDYFSIDIFPSSRVRFSVGHKSGHPDSKNQGSQYVTNNVDAISSAELMEGLFFIDIRSRKRVDDQLAGGPGCPKFEVGPPLSPAGNEVGKSLEKVLKAGLNLPAGVRAKYEDMLTQAKEASSGRGSGRTFRGFVEVKGGTVSFIGCLNSIRDPAGGKTATGYAFSPQISRGLGRGEPLLASLSNAMKVALGPGGLVETDLSKNPDGRCTAIARRHDVALPGYVAAVEAREELKKFKQITPVEQKAQQERGIQEAEDMLRDAKAMDEPELVKTAQIMLEQAKRGGFAEVNAAEVQMSAKKKQMLQEQADKEEEWARELRSPL